MSETTSTVQQEIKTYDLADLQKIPTQGHYGNYIVERGGDNCIYKLLGNPEGLVIVLSLRDDYGGGYGGRIMGSITGHKKRIEATLQEYRYSNYEWYRTNNMIVRIDVTAGTVLSPAKGESWQKAIKIGNDLQLQLNNHSYKDLPLIEENGNFFFVMHNCKFPAESWNSRQNLEPLENALYVMSGLPGKFKDRDQMNRFLLKVLPNFDRTLPAKTEGITKTLAKIINFWINEKDLHAAVAFKLAVENCKVTINSVKFSVIFNKIFGEIETQEQFSAKVIELSEQLKGHSGYYGYHSWLEKVIDSVPEARDIKKAALKRKSTGAFNKIMDDLDFVEIDKAKYPLTHEAVHSGELPLGTFFRKSGESYFIYNDNWELWEEMLAAYPEEAKQIANTCSGRTTYEKDIMSYFYFVLHALPEYLERHTGKKWTGVPKLVNSANELDPPAEGSNGVAKTRSALTPIVDNEKSTITVPYVSMSIPGYSTTYCYGLDYNVLHRGMSWEGNVVTRDIESKLNGRDDYGLMFYTLTGSSQGRGYPTFLIIFERLEKTTRVHFHRVHPTRSKGGEYNAIHNWTIGCYKWMIGNVNFERIKAQQGDLAFVEIDTFPTEDVTEVNAYDNHCFETPVKFAPYAKKDKQNVLGYVKLEKDTQLIHNEHMNRVIPAGTYEIRQCRSWEANPKGVWSLRID